MIHTNEHILGIFRKLASEANCISSFVHMTSADRLTHTMKSKIAYPILAVEPPSIVLNHEKDKESFIKKGLRKEYHFNWYLFFNSPSENHRNIDGYLALSDQLSDQLMYWLLQNENQAEETLYNQEISFEFHLKEPYINYDQDGLVGWQIQTTATAKYCKPDCLGTNFNSCPHKPYSEFKVESADGQNVIITDLSSGHVATENLIRYKYARDRYYDLTSGNTLPLTKKELVIWLMVTDGNGCYSWSRIHIPPCHGKPFCFISHPSGKCGEIIVYKK